MSHPKYLKNRKTGRKFIYTELLAKQPDMVPVYDNAPEAPTRATKPRETRLEPQPETPADETEASDTNALPRIDPETVTPAPDVDPDEESADEESGDDAAADEGSDEDADALTLDAAIERINAITDKNELEAFALAQFDLDIDKRKGIDALRATVIEAATEKLADETEASE